MRDLLEELKRRGVIRVAAAYTVAAWLIIQVAGEILPTFNAPLWVNQTIILVLLAGLPVAALLSWFFDLSPDGIKKAQESSPKEKVRLRARDYFYSGLVIVLLAIINYQQFGPRNSQLVSDPTSNLTIAVMPFEDLSDNPDQAWLASGMTESLVDALNRIQGIRVAGLQSAGILQQQEADLMTIGDQLDVGSVVYASVQRTDNELRVIARWLNVSDEATLWSARFDRNLEDVFEVQQEISAGIAEQIRQELAIDQPLIRAIENERYAVDDIRLWELWRRSLELRENAPRSREAAEEAISLCQQSVALDPSFAPGYACLSNLHLGSESTRPDFEAALEYAKQALALDPLNVVAQTSVARVESRYLRLHTAEERLRTMIQLEPSNGVLRANYMFVLQSLGRFEEAIEHARMGVVLEPLLPSTRSSLGQAYLIAGRFEEALETLNEAFEIGEPTRNTWALLSMAYQRLEIEEEALEAYIQQFPNTLDPDILESAVSALRQGFEEGGTEGAMLALAEQSVESGSCPAVFFSLAGDRERTFQCMEQDLDGWTSDIWRLVASASMATFRDDPRFQAFIQQANERILAAEEAGPLVPIPQIN